MFDTDKVNNNFLIFIFDDSCLGFFYTSSTGFKSVANMARIILFA